MRPALLNAFNEKKNGINCQVLFILHGQHLPVMDMVIDYELEEPVDVHCKTRRKRQSANQEESTWKMQLSS